jgi:predicted membrane protein
METQVRTPQAIFMQPQRLVVPLFQRPAALRLFLMWSTIALTVSGVTFRPSTLGGS